MSDRDPLHERYSISTKYNERRLISVYTYVSNAADPNVTRDIKVIRANRMLVVEVPMPGICFPDAHALEVRQATEVEVNMRQFVMRLLSKYYDRFSHNYLYVVVLRVPCVRMYFLESTNPYVEHQLIAAQLFNLLIPYFGYRKNTLQNPQEPLRGYRRLDLWMKLNEEHLLLPQMFPYLSWKTTFQELRHELNPKREVYRRWGQHIDLQIKKLSGSCFMVSLKRINLDVIAPDNYLYHVRNSGRWYLLEDMQTFTNDLIGYVLWNIAAQAFPKMGTLSPFTIRVFPNEERLIHEILLRTEFEFLHAYVQNSNLLGMTARQGLDFYTRLLGEPEHDASESIRDNQPVHYRTGKEPASDPRIQCDDAQ